MSSWLLPPFTINQEKLVDVNGYGVPGFSRASVTAWGAEQGKHSKGQRRQIKPTLSVISVREEAAPGILSSTTRLPGVPRDEDGVLYNIWWLQ